MDKLFSSTLDNSSDDDTRNFSSTLSSSAGLPSTTSKPPASWVVSLEMLSTVGLVVCSIAVCANAVVLGVLVRARRHFRSGVHALIANQSAMDLFAAAATIPRCALSFTDYYQFNRDPMLDHAICVVFYSGAPVILGLTAEKIGLVIITLERYFKIVHAIAHRKHYRDWMTKVGVALPWIGGACLILIPSIATTTVVNGQCLKMSVWPNEAMEKVILAHYCVM